MVDLSFVQEKMEKKNNTNSAAAHVRRHMEGLYCSRISTVSMTCDLANVKFDALPV